MGLGRALEVPRDRAQEAARRGVDAMVKAVKFNQSRGQLEDSLLQPFFSGSKTSI